MHITRSQFLRLFAGAGALGLGALAACDGSDPKNPDAPTGGGDAPKPVDAAIDARPIDAFVGNCTQNGTSVVIGTNHSHTVTIPMADIIAAEANRTYTLTLGAGHTHTVLITAAMFTMLKNNMTVMATSSLDGHTHSVTVNCL